MKAIGLMSGTSMDGVDVALLDTDGEIIASFGPVGGYPYADPERQLLREAVESARGIAHRADRSGVLGIAEEMITAKHAQAVKTFAEVNGIDLGTVDIIGFHGQTVVHRPERGFTVQLGHGRALSAVLGVPVVHDFRLADMERGGQGAPLVPIYHRALAHRGRVPLPAAFVNIGGIANVTFVPEGAPEELVAFDAGPGNCLLDDWALLHTGRPLDEDAHLALSGRVDPGALRTMLSHPYFAAKPPKSLDRHTFGLDAVAALEPADGAATLTALTVGGIGAAVRAFPDEPKVWIVTGGGARNPHVFEGLRRVLGAPLMTAEAAGFDSNFMEAQAFAYLAARRLMGLPASFPGTTGAREPVVAGVLAGRGPRQPARHVA